jgi:cytochrome c biogenesis protein CcdA
VLRLAGIVLGVGLADSLNPSTVGPALYLATARRPVVRVALFTLGVFAVNFAAGMALALGPGRLLVHAVPRPDRTVRDALELAAGLVLVAMAVALWTARGRLARRELPMRRGGGSALALGASIAAVELPTAAPYLGVIAAIVAARPSVPQTIALLGLFCTAFVAPLLAIIVALVVAGDRAAPVLARAGAWLERRWPVVLAALLLLVGAGLSAAGARGLLRG